MSNNLHRLWGVFMLSKMFKILGFSPTFIRPIHPTAVPSPLVWSLTEAAWLSFLAIIGLLNFLWIDRRILHEKQRSGMRKKNILCEQTNISEVVVITLGSPAAGHTHARAHARSGGLFPFPSTGVHTFYISDQCLRWLWDIIHQWSIYYNVICLLS